MTSDNHDRINEIKMEIARSVTQSRYFKQKSCTYDAPRRAVPARVKKLIRELDELEKLQATQSRRNPLTGV